MNYQQAWAFLDNLQLFKIKLGLDSMQRRARQAVNWPGMDSDLQHVCDSCESCNAYAPSQAAKPFILTSSPENQFQHTVAD